MEYLIQKMSSSDPQPIKLHLLRTITEDFSKKMRIGSGGYGEVFKGLLNGDEIAVKKLFPVHGVDDVAFDNEFRNIKKVQHKNVIRMIGYCYEIAHKDVEYQGKLVWSRVIDRAICFEYMKGGSLATHISAESCIHDWPTTYKIISGTCEGLHHLHTGGQKIFHLDLKPDNILLDEELVPKIGDFGLSRLFGTSYTHQLSTTKGTVGFMPQEYIHNRKVSPKNDVFSLGVIIFHMMVGKKGYGNYWDARRRPNFSPKIQQEFIESVLEYWKTKMEVTVGYRWDGTYILGVTKCIEMSMRCVEDDRDKRPSITEILDELKELDSKMEKMLNEDPRRLSRQLLGSKPSLQLQYLKDITNNFCDDRILGKGGFGVVYKGLLDNGEMIAVKKLIQAISSSHEEFENEVNLLMELKHQNIVQLVGYCYETQHIRTHHKGKHVFASSTESLLCFEYLPNGSLDNYISDASSRLNWHTRWKVIEGISYGLQYLHEHCNEPIIHLDLKPGNILLDANMLPKIADFGLSRMFDQNQTIRTANTKGTLGYMPPEFIKGIITPMWDIFSLGVIIMEVITGHKDYPYDITKDSKGYIEEELQRWRDRLKKETGYTTLETDCQQIERCIQIGLICVNHERSKRPTMKTIINMLQGKESMDWYISNELSESSCSDRAPPRE